MSDDQNPYIAPSTISPGRRIPGLLKVLWFLTSLGTAAFISNWLTRNERDFSAVQGAVFAGGYNLIAACAGIGLYISLRYDLRFLPPGAVALMLWITWTITLALRPVGP